MLFKAFFRCLEERHPQPFVKVDLLLELVRLHHFGVGRITVKSFKDFPGAQAGGFIWEEEERTSPYEDSFNDAYIFVNEKYKDDVIHRRLIVTKELMHVFDDVEQRADTFEKLMTLMNEIASTPLPDDASAQFNADRGALWKAILCLVPPWIRNSHLSLWESDPTKAADLASQLFLPEAAINVAMGAYYQRALDHFLK